MTSQEIQQRTFNHVLELFVHPELERRKKTGVLPEKYVLSAVQILFSKKLRKPIIRLNEETKILGVIKLKKDIQKGMGEKVLQEEIERLENIRLTDEEESEFAHISMVRLGKQWLFGFDFRYNKKLARDHSETAEQFFKAAQSAHRRNLSAPFIDNLYSCVELLAHAELLLLPKFLKEKTSHMDIQTKYNRFVDMGNAKTEFKSTLNKLSGLRISARYLKSDFKLNEDQAKDYLNTAKGMLSYVKGRLKKIE